MDLLTENFSEKIYMAVFGLSDKYLKLIVYSKGISEIEFDLLGQYLYFSTYIRKRTGEPVYSMGINRNKFLLGPGEYIVRISNLDHLFGIGRIRYKYTALKN